MDNQPNYILMDSHVIEMEDSYVLEKNRWD